MTKACPFVHRWYELDYVLETTELDLRGALEGLSGPSFVSQGETICPRQAFPVIRHIPPVLEYLFSGNPAFVAENKLRFVVRNCLLKALRQFCKEARLGKYGFVPLTQIHWEGVNLALVSLLQLVEVLDQNHYYTVDGFTRRLTMSEILHFTGTNPECFNINPVN